MILVSLSQVSSQRDLSTKAKTSKNSQPRAVDRGHRGSIGRELWVVFRNYRQYLGIREVVGIADITPCHGAFL